MAARRAPAPVRILTRLTVVGIGMLVIYGIPSTLAVLLTGRPS